MSLTLYKKITTICLVSSGDLRKYNKCKSYNIKMIYFYDFDNFISDYIDNLYYNLDDILKIIFKNEK